LAAAPAATAAADEDDLTLPSDIKAVFLGGLFVLAMLAACYVAAEIVLPIVLAFVLSLVLQPAMRVLERIRLPRGIAAILLIFLLFGTLGGLGTALSGPATSCAKDLKDRFNGDAGEDFLPMREAMRALGVSRQTVLQRVKRGELAAVHVMRGKQKGLRIKVIGRQPDLFNPIS
jgi:predicted PurR-regulated permease PerM